MNKRYEQFKDIVLDKLYNICHGYTDYVCFQIYGFSQDEVKKYWRKMRKDYDLPRAKRIEQACINF